MKNDIIAFSKLLIALGIIIGSSITLTKATGYEPVLQSEYMPHVISQDQRNCVMDTAIYNDLLVLIERLKKEKQPIPPTFALQLAQLEKALEVCAKAKT